MCCILAFYISLYLLSHTAALAVCIAALSVHTLCLHRCAVCVHTLCLGILPASFRHFPSLSISKAAFISWPGRLLPPPDFCLHPQYVSISHFRCASHFASVCTNVLAILDQCLTLHFYVLSTCAYLYPPTSKENDCLPGKCLLLKRILRLLSNSPSMIETFWRNIAVLDF